MYKKVLLLFLWCAVTDKVIALTSEEVTEVSETCCSAGEALAASSATCDGGAPEDIEPEQMETCMAALKSCCLEQHKQKSDCTAGLKYAEAKRCGVPKTEMGKTCCEECSLGRLTGESQGKEACGAAAAVGDYGPTTALRKNAYHQCCLEAANKPETTTQKRTTTPKPTTTTKKPERCSDKKQCDQLCNDDYGRVTCACYEGYRLQPDKKSCKDINECAEADDDLCTAEGTVCHNTPGAFKCVPLRKRDVGTVCPAGFKKDNVNQVCNDINECQLPRPPCPKYLCVNTIGGYKCSGKAMKPLPEGAAAGATTPRAGPEATDMCPPGFRDGPEDECVDIDECEEHSDDCQRLSQNCINTHGGFFCQDHVSKRCAPGFKVDANGVCQDIDECLESSEVCRRNEVCINLPGAYDCKSKISTLPKLTPKSCQEGMRMRPGGGGCEDVDECREGSHLCDQFQNCINTYGGHECRCKSGFQLDSASGSCVDIDECALKLDSCGELRCVNVLGSFTCARADATPPPEYEYYYSDEDNATIDDVTDEKPKLTPPPPRLPPKPTTPRTKPTRPTTPRTTTIRTTSTTTRTRPTTTPIPTTTSTTPPTTTPRPTTTTRPSPASPWPTTPRPRPTYNPFGTRPTTTRPPWRPYTNKPARRPEIEEVLVPEPEDNTVERERDNETINLNTGDLPKDKWVDPKDLFDTEQVHCLNGYEKDKDGNCVDVDECATRRYICSNLEVCRNEPGGYSCDCMSGFRRDPSGWCAATPRAEGSSTTTERVTERSTAATSIPTYSPYGPPRRQWSRPTPPPGGCDELGYTFDASLGKCVDIDECALNRARCSSDERCLNTEGGYRCLYEGGRGAEPEYSPESSYPQPQPSGPNVITVGSQYGKRGPEMMRPTLRRLPDSGAILTSCPWGYKLTNDKMCLDIDECALNTSECGSSQRCENMFGGYSCQCPKGHKLDGPRGCQDVDECAYGNPCSGFADCINTAGSYRCACRAGFRASPSNDKLCEDVDECSERPAACSQGCANTWGGYRCTCQRGYKLGSDNSTCVDVDECASASSRGARLCAGACVNAPGSYHCACPSGYSLAGDARTCVDIDECATGEASCAGADPELVCRNTRGGYHCHKIDCPLGYRLEDKQRCIRIQRSCRVSDWACLQRPSTYSYHFISFTSQIYLPGGGVDLFTMHGPSWADSMVSFELKMTDVQAPHGVRPADLSCFDMRPSGSVCVVTLVCSLAGPQVAQLELGMSLHQQGRFAGSAVARLVVIVSQYDY